MGYGELKIESGQLYIKKAINKAKKESRKLKIKNKEKEKRIRVLEEVRIVKDNIYEDLERIEKNFPNLNKLDKFYKELIEIKIGTKKLKETLGRISWTKRKAIQLYKDYKNRIITSKNKKRIEKNQREYYGRISSLLKRISKELKYLEESRKKIKELPKIKTSIKTVCITGFPNVGKSTLLKKLTKADVEIKPYAFTTKDIMMGYIDREIQVIDTPGTLNRFEKMNDIEKIANTAMKHLGELIIYVFDLTETCGYTIKQQLELLEKMKKELKKEIIIYLSKRDLTKHEKILMFRIAHNEHKVFDNAEKLKNYLLDPLT
ncbi:MAG: GTPase, partial [Candidatus Nanoarchaeia archaeon]